MTVNLENMRFYGAFNGFLVNVFLISYLNTIRAVVREGKIELLEQVEIPEGTEVLVMPLIDESDFWLNAGESSLDSV